MDYETLLYEFDGVIGTLTLNVPAKLNAHGKKMRRELLHFWRARQDDPSCRVILFTGAGRAFCSGADLDELGDEQRSLEEIYRSTAEMSEVVLLMRRASQPIIGVIRGWAAGGGFCLALAADVRIIDDTARFFPSFINIGLSGGDLGSSFHLPRQIGLGLASQYLYLGEVIDGENALRLGLVNYLLPELQLLPKALALAQKMAIQSLSGLRMTKEALNRNSGPASLASALNH